MCIPNLGLYSYFKVPVATTLLNKLLTMKIVLPIDCDNEWLFRQITRPVFVKLKVRISVQIKFKTQLKTRPINFLCLYRFVKNVTSISTCKCIQKLWIRFENLKKNIRFGSSWGLTLLNTTGYGKKLNDLAIKSMVVWLFKNTYFNFINLLSANESLTFLV